MGHLPSITFASCVKAEQSDLHHQNIQAEDVLISEFFRDPVREPDPDVFDPIGLHLFRGVESNAVVPQAQDDVVSLVRYADIQRVVPVILRKTVQDNISGHFLKAQPGKISAPGIHSAFCAEDERASTHGLAADFTKSLYDFIIP